MDQLETTSKQEYIKLLDLLARVNGANDGLSFDSSGDMERLIDAHWLTNKFIGHALIILHLLDDTNIQALPSFSKIRVVFISSPSIYVLTRTAMEAFLVFHHVFYAPTTADEKNYRYWCYKAVGITERQNFPALTEELMQKQKEAKEELDELYGKLKSNKVFQGLSTSQQGQILKGKSKLPSWKEIGIDAGFSKILASQMYSYLCGYAHSGILSVLQTTQVLINKEPNALIGVPIYTMNIVIANMVDEYCKVIPKARGILIKDTKGSNLVEHYIQVGSGLDKYMVADINK